MLFTRVDETNYEDRLKEAYMKHSEETGKCFFEGQLDQAQECDAKGEPLILSAEELEDNEDELIRIMHEKFINGEDEGYVDYN